jgi:hypothetical protein
VARRSGFGFVSCHALCSCRGAMNSVSPSGVALLVPVLRFPPPITATGSPVAVTLRDVQRRSRDYPRRENFAYRTETDFTPRWESGPRSGKLDSRISSLFYEK